MEVQDVVHGIINIPPDIKDIIDTKQFQRLKHIQQLGFVSLVLLDAKHTRFDHCIGTYWLARKMIDCLTQNTDWIGNVNNIPALYRKSVEIAALLHDIGHGAFSHTWEHVNDDFHHEENAIACVDAIFSTLNHECLPILRENDNFGLKLIKALILGDESLLPTNMPDKYRFLFEIVNNKQCKIDVDKWDYLKRDHYYLRHLCSPDMSFDDVFLKARVAADGSHIEYRYKDYHKIYTLFTARWQFHVCCYRLDKVVACEKIFCDIVKRSQCTIANKKLSKIKAHDMEAFLQLTDEHVLQLGADDEASAYLKDVSKIKPVDKDYIVKENVRYSLLFFEESILGPGDEMPPDDQFYFYGNVCDRKTVIRNRTATKKIGCFLLS